MLGPDAASECPRMMDEDSRASSHVWIAASLEIQRCNGDVATAQGLSHTVRVGVLVHYNVRSG